MQAPGVVSMAIPSSALASRVAGQRKSTLLQDASSHVMAPSISMTGGGGAGARAGGRVRV